MTAVEISRGMIVAFAATLVAAAASRDVRTAFFGIATLNRQIADLQARENHLETKVDGFRSKHPGLFVSGPTQSHGVGL